MISVENEKFEQFLWESFGDGVNFRELRLSNEEVDYLRKKYPNASVKKCLAREYSDGKLWYEINLLTPEVSRISTELDAVQRENRQLKQELEDLKKSIAIVR